MEISKETLEQWKALHSPGDASKMAEQYGTGAYPEMFHRAMRLGRCSDEVYKVMRKFFTKKAQVIKSYL